MHAHRLRKSNQILLGDQTVQDRPLLLASVFGDTNADVRSVCGGVPCCCCCIDWQIYCCLGALAILNRLYHVDADTLGWWLCERQLPSGGLNGNADSYKAREKVSP